MKFSSNAKVKLDWLFPVAKH